MIEGVDLQMMYWVILIVLAVLILVTMLITIITMIKEHKEYKAYLLDDVEDDEEEMVISKRPVRTSTHTQQGRSAKSSSGKSEARRRWKVILENRNTSECYDYIFYDAVGIGRTVQEVAFEQFMSIPKDQKISKVHCSIIRSGDRLYLRDEGSKNHTYLNGKRVQKPIMIEKEDVISIGETDIEIVKILRETAS
jgi:hypothetical protein